MTVRITPEAKKIIQQLGSIGGKKSSGNLTPEQRKERSRKAIEARWGNKREAK